MMASDTGLLREQLVQFAEFQRLNPRMDARLAVEKFMMAGSKDEFTSTGGAGANCIAPTPSQMSRNFSILNGKPTSAANHHPASPLTPESASFQAIGLSLQRPFAPAIAGYLEGSNDPFASVLCGEFNNSNSAGADVPALHIDAGAMFDQASGMTMNMPQLVYGSSFDSELGLSPISDMNSLATPSISMSRNPSGYNQLENSIDMVRLDSQTNNVAAPFVADQDDDMTILAGIGHGFGFDYQYARMLTVPSKRGPSEIAAGLDPQSGQLRDNNTNTGKPSASASKRKADSWPSSKSPPLAPATKGTQLSRTSAPKSRTNHYVRPRHPRVWCRLCPKGHRGFRGDHEARRHFEREHAMKKRAWVVRDMSGTGLLAGCKACTSRKRYGVDYNATAHLKRQHFSVEKNPGLQVPESLRDWVELVDDDIQEGQEQLLLRPRKRAKKNKNKSNKKQCDSESEQDEFQEENELSEDGAGEQEQEQQQEKIPLNFETAKNTALQEFKSYSSSGNIGGGLMHTASTSSYLTDGASFDVRQYQPQPPATTTNDYYDDFIFLHDFP